jgi:hypothetical protein
MDDRDTEYSLRIDGKYCVWQKYDLFELGEISSKIAKVAYENFSLPLPTRWVITAIVDHPEDHRNFLDEEELR